MRLEILYFGGLRPLVGGTRTEELRVDEPCDVGGLFDRLCALHPSLVRVRDQVRVAVNEQFASDDQQVRDGDRVALVPPVAGGEQRLLSLTDQPLRPGELIDAVAGPGQGAIAVFIGTVRDNNEGKDVVRLDYEAYPEMVMRQLADIVSRCEAVGDGVRVAVAHRVGTLEVGDAAVVIAASAPHRPEAFAACRDCIELLKQHVPIWKREISPDGEEWIGLGP